MSNYNATTSFLQNQARTALIQAQSNAGRIYSLPPQSALPKRQPRINHSVARPNIDRPPTFADLFDTGDTTDARIQYLSAQSDQWVAKYFPSITTGLRSIPDDWLCEVISGVRPLGMDKTIFELVWHQARDRAYRTRNTEVRNINEAFSVRGFELPPGAQVDAITAAEQRASEAILEVNVQQAIKDAEIKQQMLQFAVETATNYKMGIMSALGEFYRAWINLPDKDIERARLKAQAQAALYSALTAYHNVEVSIEQLRLRAAEAKADVDLGVDRNQTAVHGNYSSVAGGLASAVNAFAQLAGQSNTAGGTLAAEIQAL